MVGVMVSSGSALRCRKVSKQGLGETVHKAHDRLEKVRLTVVLQVVTGPES
jgi:hypothetical protein